MKTAKKVWIIIAVCLIVLGAIIGAVSLAMMNFDFANLNTEKFIESEQLIDEDFNNIKIDVKTSDIKFMLSNDEKCRVICLDTDKTKHIVTVNNGTLLISVEDSRKWYDYIGISFGNTSLTVVLPQDSYAALNITADTSDIIIPKDFTFDSIDIKGSTGDINCKSSVTNDLKITLSTGETRLENITVGNIELKASTGDTYLTNVNCNSLSSSADTGYIKLQNVDAGKNLSITRSTGDVKFEQCDADDISIKTDTGDVEGSLRTSKIFVCKTDTGSISVPDTTEGGKCEIITDTGDITISVKKNMTSGYYIR